METVTARGPHGRQDSAGPAEQEFREMMAVIERNLGTDRVEGADRVGRRADPVGRTTR